MPGVADCSRDSLYVVRVSGCDSVSTSCSGVVVDV